MKQKRFIFVPFGAIAILLALAALAYACTTSGGTAVVTDVKRPGNLTNPCGPGSTDCAMPGDELTVEASGGVYSVDGQNNVIHYYLYLNNYEAIDDGHACMYNDGGYTGASAPVLIGGPQTASGGSIPATKGIVPAAAPTEDPNGNETFLGKALVCFMGSGAPEGGVVKDTSKAVTSRVAHMWGTHPDSLRIVAI